MRNMTAPPKAAITSSARMKNKLPFDELGAIDVKASGWTSKISVSPMSE